MVLELFVARSTEGAQRIQEAMPDRLPDSGECRVFVGIDSDDDTQGAAAATSLGEDNTRIRLSVE
jgi:hypothetical protein